MSHSSVKRSGMACVNEESHSFTRHHMFIHKWSEPYLQPFVTN